MVKNIKKDIKDEEMKTKERGSNDFYDEPGVVGSLGDVAPYAKAQKNHLYVKYTTDQSWKEIIISNPSRFIASGCVRITSMWWKHR